jgi:hypothetical protein
LNPQSFFSFRKKEEVFLKDSITGYFPMDVDNLDQG